MIVTLFVKCNDRDRVGNRVCIRDPVCVHVRDLVCGRDRVRIRVCVGDSVRGFDCDLNWGCYGNRGRIRVLFVPLIVVLFCGRNRFLVRNLCSIRDPVRVNGRDRFFVFDCDRVRNRVCVLIVILIAVVS